VTSTNTVLTGEVGLEGLVVRLSNPDPDIKITRNSKRPSTVIETIVIIYKRIRILRNIHCKRIRTRMGINSKIFLDDDILNADKAGKSSDRK